MLNVPHAQPFVPLGQIQGPSPEASIFAAANTLPPVTPTVTPPVTVRDGGRIGLKPGGSAKNENEKGIGELFKEKAKKELGSQAPMFFPQWQSDEAKQRAKEDNFIRWKKYSSHMEERYGPNWKVKDRHGPRSFMEFLKSEWRGQEPHRGSLYKEEKSGLATGGRVGRMGGGIMIASNNGIENNGIGAILKKYKQIRSEL